MRAALLLPLATAFVAPRSRLPQHRMGAPLEELEPTEAGGPLAWFLRRDNPLYVSVPSTTGDLVGEESGVYDWEAQKDGWVNFSLAVSAILTALAVLWIYPATGYSDDVLYWLEHDICQDNSHLVTLVFGIVFLLVHSGLASLRPYAEDLVGARFFRVVFASCSLPLAYSWIVYFIGHAHDGVTFWNGQPIGWVHGVAWTINFLSFFFLYPSVFNLKEVAAVEVPKIHLWETGIMRITRHPQMVGQVMWSGAHMAMVGTSFTFLTMFLLVGHHIFAVWNGDRRLQDEHGAKFEVIRERTSVVPFAAILDGRQQLPPDYWKELVRAPYALIAAGTLGAYLAHPYMQAGAALVENTGLVKGGVLDPLFAGVG